DADLDALVAELICRGLDVRDVDVRDAAVLLRLPLGEPDLHRAALELRPPVVGIEERLREAELVPVERAAPVEVPHVVPDGHYRARPGSSRNCFTVARNSAPVAPSTARWSHVSVSSMRGRTAGCPSTATTLSSTAPTARIAACGGLSTAMNRSMPYIPRFEIVNVPPSRSPCCSLPARARSTRSARTFAISATLRRSAERMTGTTSPFGTATAMPTFADGWSSIASPL